MNQARVDRARELAREQGVEALALMPGPNLYYFTGLHMHVSERPSLVFIPTDGEPFAVCPAFEAERVAQGAEARRVYPWGEVEGPLPALRRALADTGTGRGVLGVEYRFMRVLERELLAEALDGALRYTDSTGLIAELRMVKDDTEVQWMQQAARLCDSAMAAAHQFIRPGVTEADVAAQVNAHLERAGHQGKREVYVASGPRSAIPHAGPTERVLAPGELCWVDLVLTHHEYVGDITRTFSVGPVSGEAAEVFRIVHDAQARARAAARPGVTGAEIDAVARDHISAAGYGDRFTHRTGHGLGLETHEEPYMVGSNHRPLVAGNAFTIEPGVYVPGLGGVRIEDDLVIMPGGAQVLTQYPRDTLNRPPQP